MKRFRFRLEGLLRVRRIREEQALGELARVMVRVNEHESVRERARQLLREEMTRFEQQHRDDFSIDLFQLYDRYLARLEAEDRTAARKLEEIRPELEQEMEKVMEARKGRRVVEILKERHKADWDRDRRKAEARELEEVNRGKFGGARFPGETGLRGGIPVQGAPAVAPAGAPGGAGGAREDSEEERVYRDDPDEAFGIDEAERPQEEPDYVQDYFERMGMDNPFRK